MVVIKKKPKKGKQLLFQIFDINWEFETQRLITHLKDSGALMAYIDLFCGAGGTSTGMEEARFLERKLVCVILGINHDRTAIASHQANHPETLHMVEDIRDVNMAPIKKLVEDIRIALPYIKIAMGASAECTHHSKAKGGGSRDADSRSLPEELYRYDEAIKPDLFQVENVIEFRSWGPLMHKKISPKPKDIRAWPHKMQHNEFGRIYSKDKTKWCNIKGMCYKKDKEHGIIPWMVPIPERKGEYFNQWVRHLKTMGYTYEDRDINSANHGAYTIRNRFYAQATRNGMPIIWPIATHAKDPAKELRLYGRQLQPYKPVREVLDFSNKGDSIFVPDRIRSPKTFTRVNGGGIKFIAGGKKKYQSRLRDYLQFLKDGILVNVDPETESATGMEDFPFIQNFHGGEGSKATRTHSVDESCRTVDTQNRFALTNINFLPRHFSGHPESKSTSTETPAGSITTKDHHTLIIAEVLPFIAQFNNPCACDARGIDNAFPTITKTENAVDPFIEASNGGIPSAKRAPVNNFQEVTNTDDKSVVQILPFIYRQFGDGGGQHRGVEEPAGTVTKIPKTNLISPESWIMETIYNNNGMPIAEPSQVLLQSRRHAYIVNPTYYGNSTDVEVPSPVVVARQDKAPLHLAQVEYAEGKSFYGIAVYESDSEAVRELKMFMAIYGIIDIRMRMLTIPELLAIQGFPKSTILKGSETNQKKCIGNSVEVNTARKLAECYGAYLAEEFARFLSMTG